MLAERVEGQVARDAQQPRTYVTSASVIRVGVAPSPYECLLGNVLGHPRVSNDVRGQPEDPALEALDEFRRRSGIGAAEPGQ
jgi:hypothetical protein